MKSDRPPAPRLQRQREPKPLRPTALACRVCGLEVTYPTRAEQLISYGVETDAGSGHVIMTDRETLIAVTTCDKCVDLNEWAARIVEAHPRIARAVGGRAYATTVVDAALVALDALGIDVAWVERATVTDQDVDRLVRHMAGPGSVVGWVSRLIPVIAPGTDPRSSNAKRWAHLTEVQQQSLRDAYGALLAAQLDKPTPIPPPSDGARGCLLCGVGTLVALRRDAMNAWGGRRWLAHPGTLGGRTTPTPVPGYLCPKCTTATIEAGALGLGAAERALAAHLKLALPVGAQLPGLRAWAALPLGTPPNSKPWAHEPLERWREAWTGAGLSTASTRS